MTFAEFAKLRKFPPVLLLHGPETYFKDRAIELLRANFQDVLRCADMPWNRVLDELRTPTLFSGCKLVVLAADKEILKPLKEYLEAPATEHVLLIYSDSEKAPLEAHKNLAIISCTARPQDIPKYLVAEFSARGKQIELPAAALLAELSGGNLASAVAHIEKLCLYVGARNRMTVRDIETLVADSATANAFDLARAVAGKDAARAVNLLHRLIDSDAPGPQVLAAIAWQYRKMIEVKRALDASKSSYEACAAAGIRWNQADWAALVRPLEMEALLGAHRHILETDLDMKSSGISEGILLDLLVFRLTTVATQRGRNIMGAGV